jgi:hypothetical protein
MQVSFNFRQFVLSRLITIVLTCSLLGWSIAFFNSLTSSILLAIAISFGVLAGRICAQFKSNIWAGACAVSFGIAFIWIGACLTMDKEPLAFIIASVWGVAFALDTALTNTAMVMSFLGFNQFKKSWILTVIVWSSVILGWVSHKLIMI